MAYQPMTRQLQDFIAYADANDMTFVLVVRPGTQVAGDLERLFEQGLIVIEHTLRVP